MSNYYIACMIVEAAPSINNEIDGYSVKYTDGSTNWMSKEFFEHTFYLMGDTCTSVTDEMVDNFVSAVNSDKINSKTVLVTAHMITGFLEHKVASCVDPNNFNLEVGQEVVMKKIKDKLWEFLSFVIQWGLFGIKN